MAKENKFGDMQGRQRSPDNRERRDFGSPVARLDDVSFHSYDRLLFENLSFVVRSGETVAITGKSGTGKSVILKLTTGEYIPSAGKLEINRSTRISLVPQELEDEQLNPDTKIVDLYKDSRGLSEAEKKMTALEAHIDDDPDNYNQYYDALQKYEELGGYEYEAAIGKILAGLGMDEKATGHVTLDSKLSELSSGQLKRVLIGRALYLNPDLLLLDDPTSHLDVASVQWLGGFLKNSQFATIVATNNPKFIDSCSDQIVGLTDSPRVFNFTGTYNEFVQKRDKQIASEIAAAENVENKLGDLRETDNMFREKQVYRRSARMAQVGRALETRMDRLQGQIDDMPGSKAVFKNDRFPDLSFEEAARGSNEALTMTSIVKKYGDFTALDLSKAPPLSLRRGEKWLMWGENGSGKSTLMRIVAKTGTDDFPPSAGSVRIGANIDLGYFAPDNINVSKQGSVLEEVSEVAKGPFKGRAVSVLRFFGFSNDAIHNQDISTISAGEKKRLALAKIMAQSPNLLLLDEPTGDYMPSDLKKRFANALNGYSGTLMLVSHDLEFINYLKINRQLNMPEGKVQLKD